MPATEGTKPAAKRRKKETFTISFRVDGFHLSRLEKGATRLGMSVHEYARLRLSELLERQDEARLLDETARLRRGVEGLREDVAATLEAILLNLTDADSEQIRALIEAHLRQDSERETEHERAGKETTDAGEG